MDPLVITTDDLRAEFRGTESPSPELEDLTPFELPSNCNELRQHYCANSERVKSMWGLLKNGLNYGRSFNSVLILVFGESNAGKSTTINKIFNDDNLCPTNQFKSETSEVIYYQKKMVVNEIKPPVIGFLRFIDTPGLFESDGKDHEGIARLKAFRKQSPLLSSADRDNGFKKTVTWATKLKIRNKVFPNIVLFVVSADAKTEGSNTRLLKSLRVLKETGFVDTKYQNLIVVVTRSAQLIDFSGDEEKEKTSFIANSARLEQIITRAVTQVLDIDADVVFIENRPQRLLTKQENSDYYVFPDGQLSHYNLLDAIIHCFHKREFHDVLGKLLIGWYLNPLCPERSKLCPIEQFKFTPSADLGIIETEIGMEGLNLNELSEMPIQKFGFEYLGHAFCSVRGDVKQTSLLDKTKRQKFLVGNREFCIPAELEVIHKNSTSINMFKMDDKHEHSTSSNLAFNFKLLSSLMRTFNVSFDKGKSTNSCSSESSIYVYQFEKVLALVKLDRPESTLQNYSLFKNAFDKVVEDGTHSDQFFGRWGTHVITQQTVGGGIYIFYTCNKSLDGQTQANIEMEFGGLFDGVEVGAKGNAGKTIKALRERGVQNERILVLGGALESSVFTLESLMKDGILKRWNETIADEPANLVSDTRFFPHFHLCSNTSDSSNLESRTNEFVTKLNSTETVAMPTIVDNPIQQVTQQALAKEILTDACEQNRKQKEDGGGCFPSNTIVYVMKSSQVIEKQIQNLEPGDQVRTVCRSSPCKLTTSKMCDYIHNAPDNELEFLVFSFDKPHQLVVSQLHVIFIITEGTLKPVKAKHVVIGDSFLFCSVDQKIQIRTCKHIRTQTFTGVFAPLTCSGTFFANGFLVTSYADTDFALAQVAMAPLKLWRSLKLFTHKTEYEVEHEIHPYAKFLMKIRSIRANMLK